MSEVIRFKVNAEEELHLAYGTGKPCSGIRGPQFLYTLIDGRIAFADPPLDAQIQQLQPKSGARVRVTMKPGGRWDVNLSPPAEKPREATSPETCHDQAPQRAALPNPSTNGSSGSNGNSRNNGNGNGHMPDAPYSHTGWAAHLRDQATSLIDVAASCHRYAAEKYPGMLRPEDVSDLLTTVYIGMNKGSGGSR